MTYDLQQDEIFILNNINTLSVVHIFLRGLVCKNMIKIRVNYGALRFIHYKFIINLTRNLQNQCHERCVANVYNYNYHFSRFF